MTEQKKRYLVDLTDGEAERIESTASEQGVSTPDYLGYCVRAISFGLNYAVSMLPNKGHAGPQDGE